MDKTCAICNKKTGLINGKIKLKDAIICKKCAEKANIKQNSFQEIIDNKGISLNTVKQKINEHTQIENNFNVTKKINNKIQFDDNARVLKGNFTPLGLKANEYINYDDILDVNAIIDENDIRKSGLGGAIGGGILFGPAGALVGGINSRGQVKKKAVEKLHINITLKNGTVKTLYFIDSKVKTDSFIYKQSYDEFIKVGAKLEAIIKDNKIKTFDTNNQNQLIEQLVNLKNLLDLGVITQEEFDSKKEELKSQIKL